MTNPDNQSMTNEQSQQNSLITPTENPEIKQELFLIQRHVKRIEEKQNPYNNPKLYRNYGYEGSTSEIRTTSGKKLLTHTSASGTIYVIDKNGSRRKVTPKLIETIVNDLNEMADAISPSGPLDEKNEVLSLLIAQSKSTRK